MRGMLDIARDTSGDNLARSGDNLARARLRMNALERQAARMAPRKYGRGGLTHGSLPTPNVWERSGSFRH
jgi:hypothetical protein